MKKSRRHISLFLSLLLILAFALPAQAGILDGIKSLFTGSGSVTGSQQPIRVYVDGQLVNFPDQQPYVDSNNRTLVPVRFVSEALGAKVDWKGQKKEVDINHEAKDKRVLLWVGKRDYTVNGVTARMDTQAVLTDQARVMVPLRFVSEALGADVRWEVIAGNGTVFTFTLGQSDDEIKAIIDRVRAEIEKETHGATVIPDSQWSYDKPKINVDDYYFNNPDVKYTTATVDQLPIKTEKYTIKSIELTPTHIVISYDTPNEVTPNLYITKGDYLWVRGSYLNGQKSIDYKYPIETYGNDDNPLTHEKLKTVDYLNITYPGSILAIENPFKEGK